MKNCRFFLVLVSFHVIFLAESRRKVSIFQPHNFDGSNFRPIYVQLLAEERSSGSDLGDLLSNDRLTTPLRNGKLNSNFRSICDRFSTDL